MEPEIYFSRIEVKARAILNLKRGLAMKIYLRIGILFLPAVSLITIPTFSQQRRPATASGSAASYARARDVIERAITALGGLEAIRAVDDVRVSVRGHSFARNQSLGVNPPYDRMTRDEELFIDLKKRRYIVETRDPLPGGFVFGGKQVITGNQGFFVNPRDRTIGPLNLTNFNNIGLIRRLPHLLLLTVYESVPASMRSLGQIPFAGQPHNVVSFASSNGIQWTLYFHPRTNLLSKYEQMVSDNVAGDAVQETVFPNYRTVNGIKVPTGRVTRRAGELIEEVNYEEVVFNARPDESAFTRPDDLEELPAPTPAPVRETKLADGVYLFESSSNSLVVEFNDHVMVVEPYAGGRGAKSIINKIKEMFPNKSIKYVVVTHHHDDHSGGVRSYIAEGVSLVTTAANQSYFERMAASTFTISRDDQTNAKRKPVFDFVRNKKRTFTDGNQIVEIIDIGPNPHAQEMLIAYLPKAKLVFQGDLVNLPANGKYRPTTVNESTVHFFQAIKKLGLNVERIAAVHGPSTSLDDLRKAIDQSQTSTRN
jgi:glyoxylase-like metal-dependent hydrolase (beta-lactamase superfamily II)